MIFGDEVWMMLEVRVGRVGCLGCLGLCYASWIHCPSFFFFSLSLSL